MTTTVILSIFSGRQNPAKQLSQRAEAELYSRLGNLRHGTRQRIGDDLWGAFIVFRKVGKHASKFYVGGGIVDIPALPTAFVDNNEVFEFLFSQLDVSAVPFDPATLRATPARPDFHAGEISKYLCPTNPSPDGQDFDEFWASHFTPDGQIHNRNPCNNCYDYANDRLTDSFSQPGYASGQIYRGYTCKEFTYAAQLDGLRPATKLIALSPGKGWYVGLFLGTVLGEDDFHWVKQDKTGCWSHKMGPNPNSEFDNSWHKIKDPPNADFNRGQNVLYKFCGYFLTHAGVTINGPYPKWDVCQPSWY